MADMVAWLLSKTFNKKSGHHRTHLQTKTLLSLDLRHPTEHWRECLYLAEAYQKAKPENLHRPSKEAEDIKALFDAKLVQCIRRSEFTPEYRSLPTNPVLDELAGEWKNTVVRPGERGRRHARVVANPSFLSEDRTVSRSSRDSFADVESVFDKLDSMFFGATEGHADRELEHQRRVQEPIVLSSKAKRKH